MNIDNYINKNDKPLIKSCIINLLPNLNIQELDIKINQLCVEYDRQMLQTYKLFLEEYKCSSIQSFKDYYKKQQTDLYGVGILKKPLFFQSQI